MVLSLQEKTKEVKIQATRIFYRNYNSQAKTIINRGGTRSGKSYAIAQLLFIEKFFNEKNKKILVLRKTLPSLKLAALLDFKKFLFDYDLEDKVREEKQSLNYYYKPNNNLIHFGALDSPEKIKCYHPDTEILTKDGFVNIADVKVGQLVATMNPETRKAEYKSVITTFEYQYEGNMISPKSLVGDREPHIRFCVTPNHKMLIHTYSNKLFFKEAFELPKVYSIPRTAEWSGKIVDVYEIPRVDWTERDKVNKKAPEHNKRRSTVGELKLAIIPFLRFLGWFISEGYISDGFKENTRNWSIGICQIKEKGIKKIKEDLKDFPYVFIENKSRHTFSVTGYKCRDLYEYLKLNVGRDCYEKRIPRDVLDLHPSLLKNLLEALIEGDGTKAGKDSFLYYTSSKQLSNDVCELATKCGYICSISDGKITNWQFPNAKPFWVISIFKRGDWNTESGFKEIPYKGKVYCVEVPPYNTIFTRYKGKSIWCGQSTSWHYCWMQEATDFTYEDYLELKRRLSESRDDGKRNQLFMCLNPIDEYHWIKEKLLDRGGDIEEIHSTHLDNPFLPNDYRTDLESLIDQDLNHYNIYVKGEWGRLEDLIYRNWSVLREEVPKGEVIYGLDFGFVNPSALVKVTILDKGKNNKEVYVEELLYETGLTNGELITKCKQLIPDMRCQLYADCAEPARIQEFRDAGFNAYEAQKDVLDGIDFVKRQNLFIHENSINLIKEMKAYSRRKDRKGKILEEPVKFNNHAVDAKRYAIYTHLRNRISDIRLRFL